MSPDEPEWDVEEPDPYWSATPEEIAEWERGRGERERYRREIEKAEWEATYRIKEQFDAGMRRKS